jgi:hypothetical protein
MKNPKFDSLLKKMSEIHDKKNSDYANDSNPYSNFEFASSFSQVPLYKVYLVLIGVKVARLHELLGKDKQPKNESIDDTLLDLATYTAIMSSQLISEDEEIQLYNRNRLRPSDDNLSIDFSNGGSKEVI